MSRAIHSTICVDVLWWHASQLGAVTGRCSRRKLAVAAANNSFTIPYVCMVKAPALLPNKASILFPAFVSLRLYTRRSCATVQPHGSALHDVAVHSVQPTVRGLGIMLLPSCLSFLRRPWGSGQGHLGHLAFAICMQEDSCVHDGRARTYRRRSPTIRITTSRRSNVQQLLLLTQQPLPSSVSYSTEERAAAPRHRIYLLPFTQQSP
jgi:hypothetical protein